MHAVPTRPRPGFPLPLIAACVVTVAMPVASAHAALAEPRACPGDSAVVAGASDADFADICQGVRAAIDFFALHGIRPTEPVSMEVAASMPAEAGATAAGCYIEQKRKVFVVPYDGFRKNKTWFNVPIDRALYRALAAHEAAHAISACHFSIAVPSIQAKEYLAYVAMLGSMQAPLRDRVMRATQTVGFDSPDRFTPMLYLFDPMRFGAEAYRHYSSVQDRAALVRAILDGKALAD